MRAAVRRFCSLLVALHPDMEALPFSRVTLSVIGLQSGPGTSRWRTCWNYYMRTMNIISQVTLISLALYSLFFLDTVVTTGTGILGIYSLDLLLYVVILSKMKKIGSVLKSMCDKMDKQTLRKIQRYDIVQSSLRVAFAGLIMTLLLTYLMEVGFGPEMTATMMGIRSKPGTHHPYAMPVLLIFYFALTISNLLVQFYISVLYVAVQAANHIWQQLCTESSLLQYDYESMKRQLEDYNKLLHTVNQELGILPFHMLGMEFIFFAIGISFLVTTSGQIEISPYYAMLTVGGVNVMYLVSLYQVIELSTECNRKMTSAWKIAEECVADPHAILRTEEAVRMRKALKFYLVTESVETPKACDTIVMDRPLVLSFFAQLIPFTVMIFTTIKELERKNS
jgi:hypothetical protein